MRSVKAIVLCLGCLGCLGLGGYELPAKSPRLLGCRLPGWNAATAAERLTRMAHRTGWRPADRLLHEGEEAVRYYRFLLRRSPGLLAARSSRSPSSAR
jgi:hypothetical protein